MEKNQSNAWMIQEYTDLRSEIKRKIELQNTLLTLAVTGTLTVLTFVFMRNDIIPGLFLLPYAIIIPMSLRIAYYRENVAKLSAYIIVYYEEDIAEINWETNNHRIYGEYEKDDKANSESEQFKRAKKKKLRHYECLLLSVVCLLLYSIFAWKCIFSIANLFTSIIAILGFLIELIITFRFHSMEENRKKWIDDWRKLKNE